VAIVNPPERARNRALNIAAQNAGLPAMRWESGVAEFDAAKTAGEAAAAARAAQGGRGYLSATAPASARTTTDDAILLAQGAGALDGLKAGATADDALLAGQAAGAFDRGMGGQRPAAALPDASNPATQAYWDRADIRAWANASEGNRKLAENLQRRVGFTPAPAAQMVPQMAAAAATAPTGDFSEPANRNWAFNPPQAGQMERLAAAAADQPNFNLAGVTGGDFRPGLTPAAAPAGFDAAGVDQMPQFQAPSGNVLPGGADPIDEAAQARLQDYLQRIKNLNPQQWNFGGGVAQ